MTRAQRNTRLLSRLVPHDVQRQRLSVVKQVRNIETAFDALADLLAEQPARGNAGVWKATDKWMRAAGPRLAAVRRALMK